MLGDDTLPFRGLPPLLTGDGENARLLLQTLFTALWGAATSSSSSAPTLYDLHARMSSALDVVALLNAKGPGLSSVASPADSGELILQVPPDSAAAKLLHSLLVPFRALSSAGSSCLDPAASKPKCIIAQ